MSFVDLLNSKDLILVRGAIGGFPLGLSSSIRLAVGYPFVNQAFCKSSHVPSVEFRKRESL